MHPSSEIWCRQRLSSLLLASQTVCWPQLISLAGHWLLLGLFEAYAPRLFKSYQSTLEALEAWSPHIIRNYPNTAFAASSINFGPRTESFPHIDYRNLSWGWCAITAFGNYDHTKGGHLVLWDLKQIIEFPPGSTIIIPSAMIRHSNTLIATHKRRYSYAQYSAGGLFRFVNNGCKTDEAWFSSATRIEKAQREEDRKCRWQDGVGLLSYLHEL